MNPLFPWITRLPLYLGLLAASVLLLPAEELKVELKNASGESVGVVTLSPVSETVKVGVQLKYDLKNLPLGQHALHLHAVSKCEPQRFETAGPEFTGAGKKSTSGARSGELQNIAASSDGTARGTLSVPSANMNNDESSVFRGTGTSLVIHLKADDIDSAESENTSTRIACGVVRRP